MSKSSKRELTERERLRNQLGVAITRGNTERAHRLRIELAVLGLVDDIHRRLADIRLNREQVDVLIAVLDAHSEGATARVEITDLSRQVQALSKALDERTRAGQPIDLHQLIDEVEASA